MRGCLYQPKIGEVVSYKTVTNSFQVLREKPSLYMKTVFYDSHGFLSHKLGLKSEVVDLPRPMWMQLIHGDNLVNKWRSTRASRDIRESLVDRFPILC